MDSLLGWFLVITAVVNTLISLYYYMRIIVVMALRDSDQPAVHCPVGGLAMVNLCAALLLAMFFLANPLKSTADRYTRNLYIATASSSTIDETVADAMDHSK